MSDTATPTAVTVTERAARRICEIVAGEPKIPCCASAWRAGAARASSTSSTWSANAPPTTWLSSRPGARVLIDPVSLDYLAGSEIDFVDDLIGAAFKIKNPQATASCGCGTSFSI